VKVIIKKIPTTCHLVEKNTVKLSLLLRKGCGVGDSCSFLMLIWKKR